MTSHEFAEKLRDIRLKKNRKFGFFKGIVNLPLLLKHKIKVVRIRMKVNSLPKTLIRKAKKSDTCIIYSEVGLFSINKAIDSPTDYCSDSAKLIMLTLDYLGVSYEPKWSYAGRNALGQSKWKMKLKVDFSKYDGSKVRLAPSISN